MGEQRRNSSCLVSRPATLRKVSERTGIITGVSPTAGGSVGLIEGRNLQANCVIPLFTKLGAVPTDLMPGDLLVGKDGGPGTVALITKPLLDYCDALTLGGHVYRIRLKEEFRCLAPFFSAFLNTRIGQAVLRKRIVFSSTCHTTQVGDCL